jgi:tRNA A37 N6-isopentenylltransferase MiaA
MQSVGYREAAAALRGELPRADLAATIAHNTWRYARRQRTWLRREAGVLTHAVSADGPDIAAVRALLDRA